MKELLRRTRQESGKLTAVLLVASLAASAGIAAEDTVSSSWRADSTLEMPRVQDGVLSLELEDAIAIALVNNLGLRVERFRRAQSLFRIDQNLGIYDLQLSAQTSASERSSPSATVLDGADIRASESQSFNFQLDQLTPYGGTVSLDWSNSRGQSNSSFSDVNPNFNIGLDVIFSQPLLRNFGRDATDFNLRVARSNSAMSLQNLELEVVNTLQDVENAYWAVVEAREQLKVAQESLDRARDLHNMNRIQVEVGTLAPLVLIGSEARVAEGEESIIRAQATVEDAADELRRLLNLTGDEYWAAELIPATEPQLEPLDVELEQAIATALEERPELQTQRLQLETLLLESQFNRNQALPRVDLQVRYGFNGLGGDVLVREGGNIFDPDAPVTRIPGGYGDALSQITDGLFDGWTVAFNVGYPLQNRSARARNVISELAVEEGRTAVEDLELSIKTQVRTAVRGVETAAKQIDSARISRQLQERNLEAEQKRYENGLATSFQVLEIQEDLTAALEREVAAITGYRRALVRYYRSIGRLLEANHVDIEDDRDRERLRP